MKRRISLLLLPLWCVGSLLLRAVQMEPLPIEQLAKESSLVVRGKVLSKSCQRDPAGRIYTKVDMEVTEAWKGWLSTNRFTLVHGGGILGDRKATVAGQAEYGVGEEVVAFLVLNPRGEGVTLGLAQGKFHVWSDPRTGERLVHNVFHGEADSLRQPVSGADHGPNRGRLTLADLKRRVRGGNP